LINNESFNWDEFEGAVQFLKNGIGYLYFRDVIKAATEYEVEPINKDSLRLISVIDAWLNDNIANLSNFAEVNYTGRANELGNVIEGELIKNLSSIPNLRCSKAHLVNGNF
jgi:hypothetical protein